MRRAARLLPGVAALGPAHCAAANTGSTVLCAMRDAPSALQCLTSYFRHNTLLPQWLAGHALHSSSSSSSSSGVGQGDDDAAHKHSSSHAVQMNPINLDQLLQNSPLAAHGSSSSSDGTSAPTQQQLTEQLLSELFDAELEQRLLSAAAAVARGSRPAAEHVGSDANVQQPDTGSSSTASAEASSAAAAASQDLRQGGVPLQQQQQQQQQQRLQPGVAAAAPGRAAWEPPQHPSSSSSSPARVAAWHPLMSTDPWAPLPSLASARQRLPFQLQQLLQQAGVTPETAAAVLAQAAADSPAAVATQQTPQQQQSKQHKGKSKHHHQQQQGADYLSLLSKLQTKQLVALLDDCQAPTYGSKELLVRRVVMLLQEPAAAAGPGAQGLVGVPAGAAAWVDGDAGFSQDSGESAAEFGPSVTLSSSSSSLETVDGVDSSAAPQKSQQHQVSTPMQQQQRRRQPGSPHTREVLAAAAARQQLLASVIDAAEVGGWLLAARAQDVCSINVRGRAGLHHQLVVASGLSQRHGHACAEAVAWQLKEKARQSLQKQQQDVWHDDQADGSSSDVEQLLPPLSVLGDASSDWAVLDAGAVAVHVLTERARRFYNLEGLWGGPQGRFITWLKPEQVVETKETIGRQGVGSSSTGAAVH